MSNRERYKREKKFPTLQCEWYFEYLREQIPIKSKVKYRHIGNGHRPEVWGYDIIRTGTVEEWIPCESPYYLYKVKIQDDKNNEFLTVHPDLIEIVA